MEIKEFGKWSPYNVSGDDPRYAADEFNRSFIKERFDCPGEFENSDFSEYYQVPKMNETSYGKKDSSAQSDKARKQKQQRQLRQNMIRQVVVMAAGSVVITTSYQAAVQRQQAQAAEVQPAGQSESASTSLTANWKWSDDYETVTLELLDKNGNVIEEIPAKVSVLEEAATCNKEGTKTYTATAENKKKTYSDTKTEPIAPLGHDMEAGKLTVSEDGRSAEYECPRCHETFTLSSSATEND